MIKKKLIFIFIFFVPFLLFSQETEAPQAESSETVTDSEIIADSEAVAAREPAAKRTVMDPAYVLEQDIATSSQTELADWCRSLGLSEEGGREELAVRIREFYQLEQKNFETIETDDESPLIITIENARTTEYFTVEAVHENYIRLSGSVSISVQDGETTHRIKADQILYNRTRKLMTATGEVTYAKEEEGGKTETFRGEGITVNLDTWSTAFMRGVSDHEMTEGETRYRFAGEVISRSGENSTVLRRAEITNAAEEESLWSIKASKLWLLPGSDWAVLNAVIKVGEIPVLWLPAFYYPGNEIIFHPVLGYRLREGTFVQTTTYILGRPKVISSSEESSISSIMGSGEGTEKVREGVFLRSTGAKRRDENEVRLSLLADAYVNLGFYIGSELTVPSKGNMGELLFQGGIGISRDIMMDNYGNYTPFFPDYDGTSNWHKSGFFDYTVPFRYRFLSTGSVSVEGGIVRRADFSWNMPFYSDPYVDNDFMNRSEDSSLFSQLKNATTPDFTISDTTLSQYTWLLDGRLSFSTTSIEPYINDLTISSATIAVSFNTRNTIFPAGTPVNSYLPNYSFFYPEKFTPFSFSASIGGMPVTLGEKKYEQGEDASIPGWPNPISPWGVPNETDNASEAGGMPGLAPPALTRTISAFLPGENRFTVDYRFAPSAASEIRFNSDNWNRQEDIDWSDVEYQLFSVYAAGNIGLTLAEKNDIYSHSLRFSGTSSWQGYSYLDENVFTPGSAKLTNAMGQVHNMTSFTSAAQYDFTIRPFFQSEVWKTSDFRYTLRGLLATGRYKGDDWTVNPGRWDRDNLEIHRIQGNFNANVMDYMQNLSITTDLPPEEGIVTADATARAWISETNARTSVRRLFEDPYYEPLYFTETLRFTDRISLRHYMVYDPEKSSFTMMTTSLDWGDLSARFTATRSLGYYLVTEDEYNTGAYTNLPGSGWYQDANEQFNPQSFTLNYKKNITLNEGGKVSFETSVDTGLEYDLQRYTHSSFYFTLSTGLKINRFLDIVLSSHSENSTIYRYFQNISFLNTEGIDLPGEKNPIIDLVNSFRFDDINKRRASGFKLKSFELDLVHHLGDWNATLGITLYPEVVSVGGKREYRFYNSISFSVQWKPIHEFQANAKYNTDDGFSY